LFCEQIEPLAECDIDFSLGAFICTAKTDIRPLAIWFVDTCNIVFAVFSEFGRFPYSSHIGFPYSFRFRRQYFVQDLCRMQEKIGNYAGLVGTVRNRTGFTTTVRPFIVRTYKLFSPISFGK
jgi:hypothetical protein